MRPNALPWNGFRHHAGGPADAVPPRPAGQSNRRPEWWRFVAADSLRRRPHRDYAWSLDHITSSDRDPMPLITRARTATLQPVLILFGTDDSALRRSPVPSQLDTFPRLKWRFEPPLDVEQDPRLSDVAANRLHQEGTIDLIEGRLDVKLDHPVVLSAPFSGSGNRLFSRSVGPIPIRIRMEHRIQLRLDDLLDDGLRNPIRDRGNPQLASAAFCFRNLHLLTHLGQRFC